MRYFPAASIPQYDRKSGTDSKIGAFQCTHINTATGTTDNIYMETYFTTGHEARTSGKDFPDVLINRHANQLSDSQLAAFFGQQPRQLPADREVSALLVNIMHLAGVFPQVVQLPEVDIGIAVRPRTEPMDQLVTIGPDAVMRPYAADGWVIVITGNRATSASRAPFRCGTGVAAKRRPFRPGPRRRRRRAASGHSRYSAPAPGRPYRDGYARATP